MSAPFSAIVLNIAKIMMVQIQQGYIKDVRKGNSLNVAFCAARHKDLFMENKN